MYLLDMNCLVALGWPNHVHNQRMRSWFLEEGMASWATTSLSEIGFVRISMNRSVTGTEVSFSEAAGVLDDLIGLGSHHRIEDLPPPADWPDWLTVRAQGYRQITDAAFVACASESGAVLVTLDTGMLDLLDAEHRDAVFCVPV